MKISHHLYRFILSLSVIGISLQVHGEPDRMRLPNCHPRYLTTADMLDKTRRLIQDEAWASDVYEKLKRRTDVYADKGSEWLTSRLQMYWDSHATDVFIRGEYYDHAGGIKAPVPTVMFTGARSHATSYARPTLEDIVPYQEDPRGLYLVNNTLDSKPHEWVNISKTGNIIQGINVEILGIARDAAFLWWITGNNKYADMAAKVFDTYMLGIYHRNIPVDLNHGHQQTLVGMTSFEVIHEDAINALVPLYDFLYTYLDEHYNANMWKYACAFKKWADNIIDNGVPHNNWNLIQARFVIDIALILEDDDRYPDGKGRRYYIDYILNKSSIRQWSLKDLANYGFDSNTGIWAECPGYSCGVVNDYANFTQLFQRNLQMDLLKEIPVIEKAVEATAQYIFPNGITVGFGDTHSERLRTNSMERMIENARYFGKKEQERKFTRMLKLFDPKAGMHGGDNKRVKVAVSSFFDNKPLKPDTGTKAGGIDEYVTPMFHASNVSWLVHRNGMDPNHSLMVSLNGSYGNHMHANGISMELYGKGLILGPDAGIGKSLYSGTDYLEYYSQFPAHNTVCVDGISSYPVMKSNHAFKVAACYPASGMDIGYQPVSYSLLNFIEPESYSDQQRLTSIVTVDSINGYYIDIFRSRKIEGGDKTHDYFYHNLGQSIDIRHRENEKLELHPTDELSFAGAHLYAYSYLFDKKFSDSKENLKTTFTVNRTHGGSVFMNMWMKGDDNRKIFTALSPITEGLTRMPDIPYDIASQPTLTYVARQYGEAWNHPFIAVYEPSSTEEPGSITSVRYPHVRCDSQAGCHAISITHRNGCKDLVIVSDRNDIICSSDGLSSSASYSFRRKGDDKELLFLGNGVMLKTYGINIESESPVDVLVSISDGSLSYTASGDCRLTVQDRTYDLKPVKCLTPVK